MIDDSELVLEVVGAVCMLLRLSSIPIDGASARRRTHIGQNEIDFVTEQGMIGSHNEWLCINKDLCNDWF